MAARQRHWRCAAYGVGNSNHETACETRINRQRALRSDALLRTHNASSHNMRHRARTAPRIASRFIARRTRRKISVSVAAARVISHSSHALHRTVTRTCARRASALISARGKCVVIRHQYVSASRSLQYRLFSSSDSNIITKRRRKKYQRSKAKRKKSRKWRKRGVCHVCVFST